MGGFEIAGSKHIFTSNASSMCMCRGLYGFIDETDENILFENKTRNILDIMDEISAELRKYLKILFDSHSNSNYCYTISRRENFIVPSYWNPNKKLYI